MIRHSVTVMTISKGFFPDASHRAICNTCGWRGQPFAERDDAVAEAHHHCDCANAVVFGLATQATTDADGEAAERRYRAARLTSPAVACAAARAEARDRIEASFGNSEHQDALDAEIDRHLAARAVCLYNLGLRTPAAEMAHVERRPSRAVPSGTEERRM